MAALRGSRVVFVLAGEVFGGAERGALDLAEIVREQGARVAVLALDDRPGRGRDVAAARDIDRSSIPNGTTRFSDGLFRRGLHGAPVVVTGAEHTRTWLADGHGIDPACIEVIPSSVRLPPVRESGGAWRARLGIADDAFVACMLAHLHAGKDHAKLLHAWRLVVSELDRARPTLLVVGRDAGTAAASKALAFDLDLGGRIRFLGEVDDVAGVLDACDVAIHRSRRELMPRGVTEPMAAALPVVATELPGTREALGSPEPGVLVPANDSDALAAAVIRLAGDAALRRRLGEENLAVVRERERRGSPDRAWTRLLVRALGEGRT